MKRQRLVEFSVDHPKIVVLLTIVITALFMTQFPKIKTDTNPKHMLPATSDVRLWNDEVDKTFGLYEDTIVIGIKIPDSSAFSLKPKSYKGILNSETLGRIKRITDEILKINGVASVDVNSFTTITNVTAEKGTLRVAPLMTEVPKTREEMERLKKALFENPLFLDRIISKDGRTAAIYVPLEKGANGKEIADRIRDILKKERGEEEYYIAGDPVARDTFGIEMFKLMAIFAPLAGLIMLVVRYLMFRDLFLSVALMMDAMVSIIWSMGLLVGAGIPVHIMSSMAPVFLMAIATDSIHIFNEFYFRFREVRDKRLAVIETMKAVGRPVRYTAAATAVGFAVLLFMHIIPVKVFGGVVAFGTIALRLLSFSFIPAMFMFVSEKRLEEAAKREDLETGASRLLKGIARIGAENPVKTVIAGIVLFFVAIVGITRINVNNNMVDWFKKKSEVHIADSVLNNALGGTSLGYVVAISSKDEHIKTPEALRYTEGLQRHLEKLPVVGKTTSIADLIKRINRVIHDDDPYYERIPDSRDVIAQYLFLFSMSARPSDIDSFIDYPARRANIWVQLKTWDARAMRQVIEAVNEYKKSHPLGDIEFRPAGIAYFNLVWNDEVLWDMIKGFVLALIAVFVILSLDFRSMKWAFIAYMPLLFTIVLIYGVIGYMGKDFDMPISVLSCLSLGMAVDFAIHFISRFRQRLNECRGAPLYSPSPVGETQGSPPTRDSLTDALLWTAVRPGKGIMRNAVLFASAFSVMLFAPLTPYITVGAFIVSMMLLSAIMTILYLPALIILLRDWLFKKDEHFI
jgi:predicted RND superfamily exporter protein